MPSLVWCCTAVLMLLGLLAAFVPVLPGPLLIFVGAGLHGLLLREQAMEWWGFVVLGVLLLIAYGLDFLGSAVGARWFGSSKWGVIGAFVGGVVGMFFFPIGLILGPVLGVFVGEWILAKKEVKGAGKATWGTLLGTTAGMLAKLAVCFMMIVWFAVDVWIIN